MSNFHFKKKVSKNENRFFFDIFFRLKKMIFVMIYGNITCRKNGVETISIFS
jgi:hypothetical protein